ncbi:MAG: Crp/Fnr family transcriptional regulator [Chloracidobacterium sp.]|nr:Crp/Fnr family transcriptional regulator [Chloracidobacterium sp.]
MDNFLHTFGAELTNRILKLGTRRMFAPNQYIFFEGDTATFLPIVWSGKVKMVRFPEAGKEVILGVFQSGEVFAIPPAMDGKQFPATAVAIEKSDILMLPREDFLALMGSSSDFSSTIMGRMCGILRDKADTVQILATSSAEQRVASVLLRLAGDLEIDEVKKISHRRQDIAEMAGLSLETTIRVIRKMANKGCFNIVGGRILLETTEPLRKLVK